MSRAYAEGTTVSAEQSRVDIERTLRRHGATSFMYATHESTAILGFVLHGRQVRFALPVPDLSDDRFRLTPERRNARTRDAQVKAWEAECRRSWRSLALVINVGPDHRAEAWAAEALAVQVLQLVVDCLPDDLQDPDAPTRRETLLDDIRDEALGHLLHSEGTPEERAGKAIRARLGGDRG